LRLLVTAGALATGAGGGAASEWKRLRSRRFRPSQ